MRNRINGIVSIFKPIRFLRIDEGRLPVAILVARHRLSARRPADDYLPTLIFIPFGARKSFIIC